MCTANSINVVGSKHKTTRQDRKVVWDFLMNELIKISFASVKIYDGILIVFKNLTLSAICGLHRIAIACNLFVFTLYRSPRKKMASLGVHPHCHELHLPVKRNISELNSVPMLTNSVWTQLPDFQCYGHKKWEFYRKTRLSVSSGRLKHNIFFTTAWIYDIEYVFVGVNHVTEIGIKLTYEHARGVREVNAN